MKIFQKRTDPFTGEVFIPKYYNQKFATKANQIKYNNKRKTQKKTIKVNPRTTRILNLNDYIIKREPVTPYSPAKLLESFKKSIITGVFTVCVFAFLKHNRII